MGLFDSEKTKQEKAKAKAAAERAEKASNKAKEEEAKAQVKIAKEYTQRKKMEIEAQKEIQKEIIKMSPEEREIYFSQLEEKKRRELELEEEKKKRKEAEKQRMLEELKQKNLETKNKLIAISKAKMFNFSLTTPGSFLLSGKSIKGTFGFVDYTVPFIYLKISEKKVEEGFLDEKIVKDEHEIEIELGLTGKYEITKKFMQGNIFSFFVTPFDKNLINIEPGLPKNDYKILKSYIDSSSRLNLRFESKDYENVKALIDILNSRLADI